MVLVRSKWAFGAMACALALILFVITGFRSVTVHALVPGAMVVRVPFGMTQDSVGQARGLDGRLYGPLTFTADNQRIVVADTYRERLLFFSEGRMSQRPVAGQMIESLAMGPHGEVLAADNRGMTVWLEGLHSTKKVLQVPTRSGYSTSLWHLAAWPPSRLWVQSFEVGRGRIVSSLDEYDFNGTRVRTWASHHLVRGVLKVLAGVTENPVTNFALGPDGRVYLEREQTRPTRRQIEIANAQGKIIHTVSIHTPLAMKSSVLLGVNGQGWIYLGVDLHTPGQARVVIVNDGGAILVDQRVPHLTVYAHTYGVVLPSGRLYLDEANRTEYQIREYSLSQHRAWRWVR